jgi:hypothetical protein
MFKKESIFKSYRFFCFHHPLPLHPASTKTKQHQESDGSRSSSSESEVEEPQESRHRGSKEKDISDQEFDDDLSSEDDQEPKVKEPRRVNTVSKKGSKKKKPKPKKSQDLDSDQDSPRKPLGPSFHRNHQALRNDQQHPKKMAPNSARIQAQKDAADAKKSAAKTKQSNGASAAKNGASAANATKKKDVKTKNPKRPANKSVTTADESATTASKSPAKKARQDNALMQNEIRKRAELECKYKMVLAEKKHKPSGPDEKYDTYQKHVRKQSMQALWKGLKFFINEKDHVERGTKCCLPYCMPHQMKELQGTDRDMAEAIWIWEHADIVRKGINKMRNYGK